MHRQIQGYLGAANRSAAILLAAASVFASAHVVAQEYPARGVGDWRVAASKDGSGCFLTRTYAVTGETTVLLGLDIGGGNHLTILNDNWSIKPKERPKLSFRLSNGGYPKHPVVGMASGGKNGFVTSFDKAFLSHFAGSKALHIYRDDIPVEQLRLDGSGAAVAELRRCVGIHKGSAGNGARGKERSRQIPEDPFAHDAACANSR